MRKLSEIDIGKRVKIINFLNEDFSIKLMEMGFIPGECIYIENKAPFKGPISVFVCGYSLSLRLEEAETILCEDNCE